MIEVIQHSNGRCDFFLTVSLVIFWLGVMDEKAGYCAGECTEETDSNEHQKNSYTASPIEVGAISP